MTTPIPPEVAALADYQAKRQAPPAEPLALLRGLSEKSPPGDLEAALRALSLGVKPMDAIGRAVARESAVKILEAIGCKAPAKMVDAAMPQADGKGEAEAGNGTPLFCADPDPWPDPVDGAELLMDLEGTIRRFVALPDGAPVAVALWVLHAYVYDAFGVSPFLCITSPEKQCGKTTLLTLLTALVPKAVPASNVTPALLFRVIDKFRPTLLIDEADTFLRGKNVNPELVGVLNSGHARAMAYSMRVVGEEMEPHAFSTWCPKAVALIGNLPGTLEDRSILVRMRRRAPGEEVVRIRLDRLTDLEPIRQKAARWGADALAALKAADPSIPEDIRRDRARDNWRPLLAVADAAGGDWPGRAREAARAIAGGESASESAGVLLLTDLKKMFERHETDRLASADIARELAEMDDRPWPEYRDGRPISTRQIAHLLHGFGVKPEYTWSGGKSHRGYHRSQFEDPFSRYLCETIREDREDSIGAGITEDSRSVRDTLPLTDDKSTETQRWPTSSHSSRIETPPDGGEEVSL